MSNCYKEFKIHYVCQGPQSPNSIHVGRCGTWCGSGRVTRDTNKVTCLRCRDAILKDDDLASQRLHKRKVVTKKKKIKKKKIVRKGTAASQANGNKVFAIELEVTVPAIAINSTVAQERVVNWLKRICVGKFAPGDVSAYNPSGRDISTRDDLESNGFDLEDFAITGPGCHAKIKDYLEPDVTVTFNGKDYRVIEGFSGPELEEI